jgi:outer membrane protein assembly factor BamB
MSVFNRKNNYQYARQCFCLLSVLFIFSWDIDASFFAGTSAPEIIFSNPLTVRWQFESKDTISSSPASNRENLYLPLSSGELVSLKVSDGKLLWKTEIGGAFSASPIADDRGVYVASQTIDAVAGTQQPGLRSFGAIHALSSSTGITLWMRTLHFPFQGRLAASASKLFGTTRDGQIYALDKTTGNILWTARHTSAFSTYPVINNQRLYLGSEDGTLLALDETTGRLLWRYRTQKALRGAIALVNEIIFFGSADGHVYAFSEISGRRLWRRRTGAAVQAVKSTSNGILVTSLDNFVYLLTVRGELLWKRQLAGRIAAMPLTDTQNALLAPLGGDACIVLSLRDGKLVNTLPVGVDGNTSATPLVAGNLLLIPTRQGLLAFAPSSSNGNQE